MGSRRHRRGWRKATWALVIWSIGMAIWLLVGLSSRGCQDEGGTLSQTVCTIGTAVGIGVILAVGLGGFVVLSLVWLMSRPRLRICPQCGEDVEKGFTVCGTCGHDFSNSRDPSTEES